MITAQKSLFDTYSKSVVRFASIRESGLSGAEFSPCGHYRYALWRIWEPTSPASNVLFIGLNPSTADADRNDPTSRRCMAFAKRWGFGGMFMLNVYAFRSTDPRVLRTVKDPVGPDNDLAFRHYCDLAGKIVAAWGVHCERERAQSVCELINRPVECLGVTVKSGSPKHPLYLRSMTQPKPYWRPPNASC